METRETGTVEELRLAHVALREDLRQLEEEARPGSGGLAKLRSRLDATRTVLVEHFRLEEQNGFMDAVRSREPRLDRAVQQLAQEHHQLAQALDALIERAELAAHLEERLREGIQSWVEHVRHHEARENELFQDAFSQDLGPED